MPLVKRILSKRVLSAVCLSLIIAGCGGGGSPASSQPPITPISPLDNWSLRLGGVPSPFGGETSGNGIYVVVGDTGVLSSPDGLNWAIRNSEAMNGIGYGNGTFVAVGNNGAILTSTDGISWTSRTSGTSYNLFDITYGNGKFVTIGYGGLVLTSSDGINWTSNFSIRQPLNAITFGNGVFVAVGDGGTIYTSADGVIWINQNSGVSVDIKGIAYGNGIFAAVARNGAVDGNILASADGKNWTKINATSLQKIIYANSTFVAFGITDPSKSALYSSKDGVIWSNKDIGIEIGGLIYGKDIFIIQGVAGLLTRYGVVFTSQDAINWVESSMSPQIYGTLQYLKEITYGNGTFIAYGDGSLLTSSDGTTWTIPVTANSFTYTTPYTFKVVNANGFFVAANGHILTSSDGLNWTDRTEQTDHALNAVSYGNGVFVAVGDGGMVLASGDGISWNNKPSGSVNTLRAVSFGKGTFVAVGELGEIVSSKDGLTWTRIESGTLYTLKGIAYGNGLFVIGGYDDTSGKGIILTSTDGANWTPTDSDAAASGVITFGCGSFVSSNGNTIYSSSDGINWVVRNSNIGASSIIFGNNTFVAVTAGGSVYQSDPLTR